MRGTLKHTETGAEVTGELLDNGDLEYISFRLPGTLNSTPFSPTEWVFVPPPMTRTEAIAGLPEGTTFTLGKYPNPSMVYIRTNAAVLGVLIVSDDNGGESLDVYTYPITEEYWGTAQHIDGDFTVITPVSLG